MPVVYIDCERIRDWASFHGVFARAMGFPAFYGRNMNAWIDCMTSLDSPEDGMTSVHCVPPDAVTLLLDRADLLPPEISKDLRACAAFVNQRRLEVGEPAVLQVAFWGAGPRHPGVSRTVAIAAGANLGDPAAAVHAAFNALARSALVVKPYLSPLYRTAPVRVNDAAPDPGGEYVNAAIVAKSAASPQELLALLHDVERRGGRDRGGASPHGAPRPIDLDLLLVGDLVLDTPGLVLPHPRMHQRAFVLAPLAEIAPDLTVVGSGGGAAVAQLLARLGPLDPAAVRRIEP